MTVKLTGPANCAECGTGITEQTCRDGDAGHFTFTIEDVSVEVPGLYICTPCTAAIMVGERESGVTYEAAAMFLVETYIPLAAAYIDHGDGDKAFAASARHRLHWAMECAEILAMASLLEAMEKAAEAEGCDPEDMVMVIADAAPLHPRDRAELN